MSDNCNHPTCFDSPHCRRAKKPKKIYRLKRTGIKKKAYKIKPFSEKRKKINKEQYQPKARQYVIDNPVCAVRSPVCIGVTQGVHHKKGKDTIEDLLNEENYEPSCNPCNDYIEANHQWAVDNGHKISKHQI